MTTPLLSVQNLKVHFPIKGGILLHQVASLQAVNDVSFDVMEGETLGLVGESGCGKSTVAKTVLRLYEPTAGEVYFDGKNIAAIDKEELRLLRREMQIIFQDPAESLNARHTIGTILGEPFVIHNVGKARERKQRVAELLGKVGLPADAVDRFPHEFSGGQRQRIGIARAIALNPKLLICDEPVSALDVSVRSQILNLLMQLQKELNLTLIFIAHDLAVVKHISDRIAVMYLGRIVETAASDTLYQRPLHPYTHSLIRSIPVPDPAQRKQMAVLEGDVPSPINPPSGCHFHTRCPHARKRCLNEVPLLRPAPDQPEHLTACHFAEEIDGAIE
jgi:oligopeptide/dipeptide ABC transporter ATP-binding protein